MRLLKSIFFFLFFLFVAFLEANEYRADLESKNFTIKKELIEFPAYFQGAIIPITKGTASYSIQVYPQKTIGSIKIDYIVLYKRLFLVWFLAEAEYQEKTVLVAHLENFILVIETKNAFNAPPYSIFHFTPVDSSNRGFFFTTNKVYLMPF